MNFKWLGCVMRLNTLVTLGASAAFGIMAIFLARSWINGAIADEFTTARSADPVMAATPHIVTIPVLVTDIDLAFGDEITSDILRIVDMPEEIAPYDAFADIADIFSAGNNAPILALGEIRTNEVILPHKVSGQGARSTLSARIKPGYRAAAIRVDDVTGVAGFIVPGDLVDILYTAEPNPDADVPNFRTDILLQSIKVLGIDQNHSDQSSAADVARTVTVEVSHMDAQALAAAMEGGTLSLSLRAAGETQISAARSVNSNNLTRRAVATRKAPRKRTAPQPDLKPDDSRTDIIVFRGEDKTNVTVLSEDLKHNSGGDTLMGEAAQTELAGG